ncbi:MAG: hypothetical protein JXB24_14365 [Bacteroidales bacterium]|nr:hypothetical protein [Bacteroidales bacterium]
MRNIGFITLTLYGIFLCSFLTAQNNVNLLVNDFVSDDWKSVKNAKENLENLEKEAITEIINILNRDEIVKLTNTGSLIYPGAERFFGHGQIVDYDIDNLSIRAGWLLEDLSFNNFGFSGYHLPDDELITFIRITFPEYYNNSNNRKKIEASSFMQLRSTIHKLSVDNVLEWWDAESEDWTRLDALVKALHSFDEKRQVKALFYLRNGTTRCTGLTKDYYIDNISKEVVRLASSDTKRVSEHARLILFDTKFSWLDSKTK